MCLIKCAKKVLCSLINCKEFRDCVWSMLLKRVSVSIVKNFVTNVYILNISGKTCSSWLWKITFLCKPLLTVFKRDSTEITIVKKISTNRKTSYQHRISRSGGRLNKKDVLTAVLSLTWKSPYVDKTVFILRRGPVRKCLDIHHYLGNNGDVYYVVGLTMNLESLLWNSIFTRPVVNMALHINDI